MRKVIFDTVSDLVASFVYYDRIDDEDLSADDIIVAIEAGQITIEDIVDKFEFELNNYFKTN